MTIKKLASLIALTAAIGAASTPYAVAADTQPTADPAGATQPLTFDSGAEVETNGVHRVLARTFRGSYVPRDPSPSPPPQSPSPWCQVSPQSYMCP